MVNMSLECEVGQRLTYFPRRLLGLIKTPLPDLTVRAGKQTGLSPSSSVLRPQPHFTHRMIVMAVRIILQNFECTPGRKSDIRL